VNHSKLLILWLILLCSHITFCQHKFNFGIQGDLFSIPIVDPITNAVPGKFNTSGKAEVNEAFYGEFYYWPHRNFGVFFGAGMHTYNFHAEYEIPSINFENEFAFDEYRKLHAITWSPTIGISYRAKRFMGKIGMVSFDPTKIETSAESDASTYILFNTSGTGKNEILFIDEDISIVGDPSAYQMIQTSLKYEISKNFFLNIGIEFTTGTYPLHQYHLYIEDISPDDPSMRTVVNDLRITTKYTALTLGMSYFLGFGKYKVDRIE